MVEQHSEAPYVFLGILIGIGGAYVYWWYINSQKKSTAVNVIVKLLSNDKIPVGADAKVAILKMDDKSKVIDYTNLTKNADGTYSTSLNLNSIPTGAYLLTVAFYNGTTYIGDIETEVTIPNDIGLVVPDHEIGTAGTLGVNLRG